MSAGAGVRKCGSAEELLRQFDVLAEAPNGVQKLRELILQLAVRGKLVPQDPGDAPASVLLERIAAERERLFTEGKIGKQKPLPAVSEDEAPFAVPEGWAWVRLGCVIVDGPRNGYSPKPVEYPTDTRAVTLSATTSGVFDGRHFKYIAESVARDSGYWLVPGDLLFQRGNSIEYVGIAAVYDGPERAFIYPDLMIRVRCSTALNVGFIHLVANSLVGRSYFVGRASGTSGSMPKINQGDVLELPVPLPPLPEQHRIVATVNELMALCDQLETRQQRRAEARARLNRSALHHLSTASNDAELDAHWQRLHENFHLLYDAPEMVTELRQAVLQLAVRGKLVRQDPGDEPASVLLERIAAEKERLFTEGKIAKPKALPPVKEEEVPFAVPAGWAWALFGEGIELVSGQHLTPAEYNDLGDGLPYLTGPADFGDIAPTASRWTHERRAVAKRGDVLLTVKGAGIGKTNVLAYPEAAISRQLMAIRPVLLDARFIDLLARSAIDQFRAEQVGIAIPGIGRDDVLHLAIALPPLPEQHRIVAKVNELMALCDRLEARLADAREKSAHLAASVVHHLTAA